MKMRVFIGIELPKDAKQHLDKISRIIQKSTYKGQFTLYDNYHITIKYIGQATSDDIDTLENMIDYISTQHKPFSLSIEDIGSFVKKGKHIVWVGVNHGKKALKDVYDSFEELMVDNGFKVDERKFQPHITLGKNILFSYDSSTVDIPYYSKEIPVAKITLFWSHREDDVLVYTPIYERQLSKS
jgi:2'-5' RNA ligase